MTRPRSIRVQEVLRQDRSKGAVANNGHIEWTTDVIKAWITAGEALIEAVAKIATEYVAS